MATLFEKLKNKSTLYALLSITIPLILLSKWSVMEWDLILLDGIKNPDTARALIKELTQDQTIGHIWFTSTIDVLLPFAAAGLFASATLLSFEKYGVYLACVALAAIPIDLGEGVIQVLALTETSDLFLAERSYNAHKKSLL